MKKKILFCASTTSHLKNFHLPYLKELVKNGYEVWTASKNNYILPFVYQAIEISYCKHMLSFKNIIAIFQMRNLLKQEKFDVVSTHTTLAGAVTRLAVLLLPKNKRPKIYHTCHGYLSVKSLIAEKICAIVTDVLMVMNQEDLKLAKKYKLYKSELYFIHGMGIDLKKYVPINNLKINNNKFLFIYAAEFSKRKNHTQLICVFAKICKKIPTVHLILAGDGVLFERCKKLAKFLKISDKISFLGYIEHMEKLYPLCDLAISTSLSEGIPFNIMEAMACGLPVIASNIKGHIDLMGEHSECLFHGDKELAELLIKATKQKLFCDWRNQLMDYEIEKVKKEIMEIYK